jgi:uncharacterized membrane protein
MRRLVALLAADLHLGHDAPSAGTILAIVVLRTDMVPTRTSRVGSVAASRTALTTFSGSIIGVGSFGSWSR